MTNGKNADEKNFVAKDGKEYPAVTARIAQAMLFKSKQLNKKLSWSALAQEVGLTPQAPISWKKGKISKETLEKIAAYTGVSTLWLITGEGSMEDKPEALIKSIGYGGAVAIAGAFAPIGMIAGIGIATIVDVLKRHQEYESVVKALEEIEQNTSSVDEELLGEMETKISEKFNNINENLEQNTKLVPLISLVAAGGFKEAILNAHDGYIASYNTSLSKDAFALEVDGMSMAPDFMPGDKIICDPNVKPYPGDCVIAQKFEDGIAEATFKKYKPRGFDENGKEYFELEPINPDYPIMTSKFQNIEIIATVVEHFRSLRRNRI
ncbi:hypothetical protein NRA55_14100 [Acinetobacter baumannii]|nr:hypothetical protein [Acinetobacter baumannii]